MMTGDDRLKYRGLSRAEMMMSGDWWQVCKSDRCRAWENKETRCPRGGGRAEHLLGTAMAVTVPSPQWAPPGDPPGLSGCSSRKSRSKDASKMQLHFIGNIFKINFKEDQLSILVRSMHTSSITAVAYLSLVAYITVALDDILSEIHFIGNIF